MSFERIRTGKQTRPAPNSSEKLDSPGDVGSCGVSRGSHLCWDCLSLGDHPAQLFMTNKGDISGLEGGQTRGSGHPSHTDQV